MTASKKCTRCHKVKETSEFGLVKRKGGMVPGSWCYLCCADVSAIRNSVELKKEKTCTKCNAVKTMDGFPKSKQMSDGRGSWCKSCVGEYVKTWRLTARETPKVTIDGKECSKCGFYKHHSMFSPQAVTSDGLHSWCKTCVVEQKHSDRATPEGRERTNAAARKYRKTEKAKTVRKKYRDTPEYRMKDAARKMVVFAVKASVIERPIVCSMVGQGGVECGGRIEGHHHNGYDVRHWLDVVWVCQQHHNAIK